MIVEWFLTLCAGFVGMLGDAFGPWSPPSELVNASTGMNDVMSNFHGLGVWVEWAILIGCIATQIAVWGSVVGIKLLRAIAAHIPGFGGAGD